MVKQSLRATVDESLVKEWIDKIGRDSPATVPLLQAVQSEYGYLPRAAMDYIVEHTNISGGQLYGVATFYSQFRLKPVGRHKIKVCHGTACHVRGADRVSTALRFSLDLQGESDTSPSGGYTVENVACVGCCSLAPVMVINDDVKGDLTGALAERELKKHARKNKEAIGVK
ncbi:MAG: NAD(P)H-dependent oxidoreductase subunit E [Bacteriovoracaceae bacterium]|nr:NAD(P)H-dependent oxidoreductase subunit E [Bacteriovoracaceae bacterium]